MGAVVANLIPRNSTIPIASKKVCTTHIDGQTSVEFRDSIPRTATGKVQKFKLRESYWAGHDRLVN